MLPMKKSHNLHIPSGWSALSWEQLRLVYESQSSRSVVEWKLYLWLTLQGLELCGESYFQESLASQKPYVHSDMSVDAFNKVLDALHPHADLSTDGPVAVCVWRRKRRWWERLLRRKSELFGSPIEPMLLGIEEQLSWLSDDKLIQFPCSTVKIRCRHYKLPDALFSNISYEQFSNCQHSLQDYWGLMEEAERLQQQLRSHRDADLRQDIDVLLQKIRRSKADFLSHLLIPVCGCFRTA